ncbi:peptidylprolyl isomerase [Phocaeicola oris]|uniref:peptidylprolyl isomerase n=1 Tax=Phocaeicola oris TaxID=2896850 RepID=UPI00234F4487|nr:peptidylprolyl isomerase [Phocaeicola oris]MCE2616968.1 peptidylprolyl isomerase [Phocaeicola oris]
MKRIVPVILMCMVVFVSCHRKISISNVADSFFSDTLKHVVDTFLHVPPFNPYTLGDEPIFDIVTTKGTIRVKLYKETPLHRENFARLAAGRFYDNVLFHRVINRFMIQGGDPWTKDPNRTVDEYGWGDQGFWIPAEFVDTIRHKKGALAAAREGDDVNPEKMSSSSQFYIVQDEDRCKRLDGNYTVFGQTIGGMDVIDSIANVPTGAEKLDMPNEPVRIITIKLVDAGMK